MNRAELNQEGDLMLDKDITRAKSSENYFFNRNSRTNKSQLEWDIPIEVKQKEFILILTMGKPKKTEKKRKICPNTNKLN